MHARALQRRRAAARPGVDSSVNPQGDPGTDKVGEQAMGEYVAGFLRALDADVQVEAIEPGRPNITATFAPATNDAPRIAFAPHLDTVSVSGMTIAPFDPVIRDGKLWGRGSSDTKGPMAAALWALRDWAQSSARAKSRVHWTFFGLMGEEAGNEGAWAVAKKKFSSDLTLVLEPTDLKVVTAHKGVAWMDIFTSGVACHGSTPEKGRNAIYAMSEVLEILQQSIIPKLAQKTHPKLGASSLNVGTISGGSKINIVPDRCRIEVDCRLIPAMKPEELRARSKPNCVVGSRTRKSRCNGTAMPWPPTNRCPGCSASPRQDAAQRRHPGSPMPPSSVLRAARRFASAPAPSPRPIPGTSSFSSATSRTERIFSGAGSPRPKRHRHEGGATSGTSFLSACTRRLSSRDRPLPVLLGDDRAA